MKAGRHRTARFVRRTIVFIVLGAVVNVAVAWGCVLRVSPTEAGYRFSAGRSDTKPWTLARFDAFGTTLLFSERGPDHDGFRIKGPPPEVLAPGWSTLHAPLSGVGGRRIAVEYRVVDGRGWPLRTLASHCTALHWEGQETPVLTKRWMIDLDPSMSTPIVWGGWGTFRWLPLRPIWPGFAINTALYAGASWLLIVIPGAVRRRLRIWRGQCPACGYDLRGHETTGGPHPRPLSQRERGACCPECGWKREE